MNNIDIDEDYDFEAFTSCVKHDLMMLKIDIILLSICIILIGLAQLGII